MFACMACTCTSSLLYMYVCVFYSKFQSSCMHVCEHLFCNVRAKFTPQACISTCIVQSKCTIFIQCVYVFMYMYVCSFIVYVRVLACIIHVCDKFVHDTIFLYIIAKSTSIIIILFTCKTAFMYYCEIHKLQQNFVCSNNHALLDHHDSQVPTLIGRSY